MNVRRVIALLVAATVFNVTMLSFASASYSNSSPATINIIGTVKINGLNAMSGQTLFSRSDVVTLANSEAMIQYRNSGRLKLAAESVLTVDSSTQQISVSLQKGEVLGSTPAGVSIFFTTTDLSITAAGNEPVIWSIQTQECEGTSLSVKKGALEVRAGDKVRIVNAGEDFSTSSDGSAQSPQNNLSHRKRVGLIIGIGAAIGVVLAIVLGNRKQQTTGGGCVVAPSGSGGSGQCS